MFVTRLISGIILIILTIAAVFAGNTVLMAAMLFVSLVGMMELYRIFKINKDIMGITGYLAAVAYYMCLYFKRDDLLIMVIVAELALSMAIFVLTFPKYKAEQAIISNFGLIYVTAMLSCIYRIRMLDGCEYIVWLAFICAWGNDTCAYVFGKFIFSKIFGKHKMAPVLSPNKSIEGGVGGVLGAVIIGAVYAYIFRDKLTMFANPCLAFAITSGFGALLAIIGDLAASGIKRNYDIKDNGKLIPGHGGILDRFDSVILTAPAVYFLITFLL